MRGRASTSGITGLGPDILAPELDERRFLRRLREDDPTRPIGDALLDQRTIAGIGNVWKCEGCWSAQVDPWRPAGEVERRGGAARSCARCARACRRARCTDAERPSRPGLRPPGPPLPALRHDDPRSRPGRRQPNHVLVPGMPAMTSPNRSKRIGHKGADHIAPGNTFASFDAALAQGVDMIEFDVLPERLDGSGELLLAHDYVDASRRTPRHARGGPRALRAGRLPVDRARRRHEAARLRGPRRRRAARARAGRAHV